MAATHGLLGLLVLGSTPASARQANIVTFLIDDMDLERIPFYPQLDPGAAWQLQVHRSSGGCLHGAANCTYTASNIEGVGARGAKILGAHVPVSVCTPSRYALLTGRLPSSSPFYSATFKGHSTAQVDISWNTWLEQGWRDEWKPCCGPGVPSPCSTPRMFGCSRRAQTLGSMLQRARYYTGFVGKYHLAPTDGNLESWHRGQHGKFPPSITAENEAVAEALQAGYEAARETYLAAKVRAVGFNFTGALSVGNVVDLNNLGLGVHNMDWEAGAGVEFLETAHDHVARGHASAYFLHLCTTLTHSPGPRGGICADPRLSEGGLISAASVLPSRQSIMQRTGGERCSFAEYDASHTLWVDEGVGALLKTLRRLGDEEDTLFVVLADHQRVGKGTLYHGIRTPFVLQYPRVVPAGQTLPPSVLVSSLDLMPTALDAAGLLPPPPPAGAAAPHDASTMPFNAGARLDGRSLLPLLRGGLGFEGAASNLARAQRPSWWRETIFAELGVAATVKHTAGWQLVALHMPDEFVLTTDGGWTGLASEVLVCEHERLRTGAHWTAGFTHARHCAYRDTNHSLSTNLIGEARDRFSSGDRYQNFHAVEQLLHTPSDLAMEHDYKTRCPRQLLCLQERLRAYLSQRVHFDGDAAPFGEYTYDTAAWAAFTSGGCDPAVLALPPSRCNDGLPAERSVLTCPELQERHAPSDDELAEEAAEDEVWERGEPHRAPECAPKGGDCLQSGCCKGLRDNGVGTEDCYMTLLGTARCKSVCHSDDTWSCQRVQVASPPPPPQQQGVEQVEQVEQATLWQHPPTALSQGSVCAESSHITDGSLGCPGPLTHADARSFCRRQGARLCTADEVAQDAAAGTGCGLDRARVWSGDFCGDGDKHFVSIGGSSAAIHAASGAVGILCVHHETLLPPRCCADDALPPQPPHSPPAAPSVPPTPSPPPSPPPPSPRLPCASNYGNCFSNKCCTGRSYRCFVHHPHLRYAQCRPACLADWDCTELKAETAAEPIAPQPTNHGQPGVAVATTGSTVSTLAEAAAPSSSSALQSQGAVPPPSPALATSPVLPPTDSIFGRLPHSRMLLFAACVLATVGMCAGCVLYHATSATRREIVRERAMGTPTASTRLKVDLRARSSIGGGTGSGRLRNAAYIQMVAPMEDHEPVELCEESLLPSAPGAPSDSGAATSWCS